jgi:hypothetical protein
MMKQGPVKFTTTYSRYGGDGDTDFLEKLPYVNNDGKKVLEFITEMVFDRQIRCGILTSVLIFSAYEIHADDYKQHLVYTTEVFYEAFRDGDITPSVEQTLLIEALSHGELRGRYAENIANSLYVDLFLKNPKSKMREFLPDVVEYWETLK